MIELLKKQLKGKQVKIVFPEGEDRRVLKAAVKLQKEGMIVPVVLGDLTKINELACELKLDIKDLILIDPKKASDLLEVSQKLFEVRKGKMTEEEAKANALKGNYYGTMLVYLKKAAGLLGGATYSTADTVRPALQIIKTKPNVKLVSSCFILDRKGERLAMADCAINLNPDSESLKEIALSTAETARLFGINPRLVFLSYSTLGSGKGDDVLKVQEAKKLLDSVKPNFVYDGEMQFDASVSPDVQKIKAPNSPLEGKANVFVFPDINSGNIGYKIAQRLGGFEAYGPILQGLNAPINDLSRGCSEDEIYLMAYITACQK